MRRDLDVARWLQRKLVGDEFGCRCMSDRDEHPIGGLLGDRAGLEILQTDMRDFRRVRAAADFLDLAVPHHLDLGMVEQPVLQDAFGAQAVAAMHQRHRRGMVGEIERFLDRGVAAADHDDVLVAIEEAVAGGAGRDAEALELFFGRQAEPARLGAGGENDHFGEIDVAGIAGDAEGALPEFKLVDVIGHDPRADMGRLLLHLFHQPGTLDDIGEARVVLHIRGDGELSAGLDALDQDRLQHRARGVNAGGVASRTGADDDNLGVSRRGHNRPFDLIERIL